MARSAHNRIKLEGARGKAKYIPTPDHLWAMFEEHVDEELRTPFFKREYVGKDGREVDTPLQVPITWEGFVLWCGYKGYKYGLKEYEQYPEFQDVVKRIKDFCFVQNFKGAAVGLFSHALIARKLGLVEKQENKNDNKLEVTLKYEDRDNPEQIAFVAKQDAIGGEEV